MDDNVEFALRVVNTDWMTRDLIDTLVELEDCESLQEATTLAEKSLDQLKELVIERYSRIVGTMKSTAVVASREERIRMQGGQ